MPALRNISVTSALLRMCHVSIARSRSHISTNESMPRKQYEVQMPGHPHEVCATSSYEVFAISVLASKQEHDTIASLNK